jgi:hypothetical protein
MRGQSDHTRGARHAHRDSAVDIGLTDRKATLDSPTSSYKNWAAAEHGIGTQNHYDPVEDDFVSAQEASESATILRAMGSRPDTPPARRSVVVCITA